MIARAHIHVIDPDSRRRAGVFRDLIHQNVHAEVYEDLDEFALDVPRQGAAFIFDAFDADAIECLRASMHESGVFLPIAFYSNHPSTPKVVEAVRNGAIDYLEWPFDLRLLSTAIERLRTEGDHLVEQERRKAKAKCMIDTLSGREKDVLFLVVEGHSNKTMAECLGISPRTVEIHRGNMMRKLRAAKASEVVRIALQAGLHEDKRVRSSPPLAA